MEQVFEKFLRYVAVDTASDPEAECFPSTEKQKNLGRMLREELSAMGAQDARMDEYGYVYAVIPPSAGCEAAPALGLIAHMDTSPDAPGANIRPRIVKNYGGGDVLLNEEKHIVLSPEKYPYLNECVGQDLIVTDGTTLLGADDKAGVAEIMQLAEALLGENAPKHGKICIAFTPDEEVGQGADYFDLKGFGAAYAYTVDGGALGGIEYENFNAASAKVQVNGVNIHPGDAKNKMKNALHIAMEFDRLLPPAETPAHTEGYEGFYHLNEMAGDVEGCAMHYIIRDHDRSRFEARKEKMRAIARYLNETFGEGTVELTLTDSYYNMREKIEPHLHLIETAQNAMRAAGVEPVISPIRGGTDGARLSFEGLPCPNLSTGGCNYHGRFEYIPIQSMEKMVEVLEEIVRTYAEK